MEILEAKEEQQTYSDKTGEDTNKNKPFTSQTPVSSLFSNGETETEPEETGERLLSVPHMSVNRMGLAAEEASSSSASSRRLRAHLREPSKRSRSQSVGSESLGRFFEWHC